MTRTDQPSRPRGPRQRRVLVSGAGIAGTALAYWLTRHGCAVTVVEKAATVRSGGYPVDVRGAALEVVRSMGLLPGLREAHVDLRRLTFLDRDGGEVASLHPHAVTGGVTGEDLEVRRGDLTDALHSAVRDDVEFLFRDSIDTLDGPVPASTSPSTGAASARTTWCSARTACTRAPGSWCSAPRIGSTATSATASPCSPCATPSGSPTRR
ncbi:hypothetical protein SFUMM280S_07367 [Streptomyces fumanus]